MRADMNIVNQNELADAIKLGSLPKDRIATMLMNALKLNKVNQLYANHSSKRSVDFLNSILNDLDVNYEINPQDLKRIPQNGAFITVSNHPFGGVDGLLLLRILLQERPDFNVIGNFLLKRIKPIEEKVLAVNPFDNKQSKVSSIAGLKQSLAHLDNGAPVGIFPAGEVSSFDKRIVVQDKPWSNSAIRFIKNAKVPVVPIYFHGSNSTLFHILGLVNPLFRTAKLPSELFNKKKQKIQIRIGHPIDIKTQEQYSDVSQYGRFLRAKTYALGSALEVRKFFNYKLKKQVRQEEIVAPESSLLIRKEVKKLRKKHLLFESGNYAMFFAPSHEMPTILNEIGRLREETFREVGEGTNRSIDLDEYDLYYEHLFLWDNVKKQIVGAYRVGKGQEIMKHLGIKGFYTSSLFQMKKKLEPVLEQSLELGRSFISKTYQKTPMALFLLWKGILYVLLKNRDYRYLFGPVSISNKYSTFSKSLIIDFIQSYHFHHELANYVKPKNKFKVSYKKVDHLLIKESVQDDIKKLDKIIEEIESSHFKMPVLFKKYLKQNAKILGFNVDPRFNKALDGLMILDLVDVPLNTVQSLSKEFNDKSILNRFNSHLLLKE
jgi:putative hemolysin